MDTSSNQFPSIKQYLKRMYSETGINVHEIDQLFDEIIEPVCGKIPIDLVLQLFYLRNPNVKLRDKEKEKSEVMPNSYESSTTMEEVD